MKNQLLLFSQKNQYFSHVCRMGDNADILSAGDEIYMASLKKVNFFLFHTPRRITESRT